MDDGVRGERGVDKGWNISWGFWGGGLHLPLLLDMSVSMEHSEGLLGTNRGVDTSHNIVLGVIPRACVLVGLVLCANFEAPWIIHGRSCGGDQPVLLVLAEKILWGVIKPINGIHTWCTWRLGRSRGYGMAGMCRRPACANITNCKHDMHYGKDKRINMYLNASETLEKDSWKFVCPLPSRQLQLLESAVETLQCYYYSLPRSD